MAKSSDASQAVLVNKPARFCHWALVFLLAIAFGLKMVSLFVPFTFKDTLDIVLLVVAAIGTIIALWRQMPMQNILLAAGGIAVLGGGFSALGVRTGMPFGQFIYTPAIGPAIFNTLPWVMPLVWVVMVLNSRGVARLILRPWRKNKNYGFRLIGLTAVMVLLFDLALEPFVSRVGHYWRWMPTNFPVTWQGASLMNFPAWLLITLLMMLFVTPALIVKRPRPRTGPDYHPLCVWLGGILLFGAACAMKGAWPPVIVDGLIGIATTIFAIRGAVW